MVVTEIKDRWSPLYCNIKIGFYVVEILTLDENIITHFI